jgi:hypothetical protein
MTHLLSFLLFIYFFHIEYPLLIETSLLRSYVLFFFFLLLLLLSIFIYGGLHNVFGTSMEDMIVCQLSCTHVVRV